jgi:hypothetical protein
MTQAQFFLDIMLEFFAYFALIAGILGIILFTLMLKNLKFLKFMGQVFNRAYSLKKLEHGVNHKIGESLSFILLLHPAIFGTFLCAVSVFLIFIFSTRIELEKFVNIFHVQQSTKAMFLMGMQSFQLLMIISLGLVFLYGLLLVFRQRTAMNMVKRFDKWYRIDESIEKKLETTVSKDIDTISFLRNKMIGKIGLIISIILLIIAMLDIILVI